MIETIIIGVVVAVLAGLILRYIFGGGRNRENSNRMNVQNSNTPALSAGGDITAGRDVVVGSNNANKDDNILSTSVIPAKITKKVDDAAPYQRDAIAKSFEGIKVSWMVNLESILKPKKNKWHLMLQHNKTYPWVECHIDPALYPELKRIHGQTFKIDGQIESVSGGTIKLKDCKLHLKDIWG